MYQRGAMIRAARLKKGLSQEELAAVVGVSRVAVTKWEANDRIQIGAENLDKLDQALGLLLSPGRRNQLLHGSEHVDFVDYAMIPFYGSPMSAGDGAESIEPDPVKHLAFRADWIKSQGWKERDLELYPVRGDSMSGFAEDGDVALVNKAERELRHRDPRKCVFRVQYGRDTFIKHVSYNHRGEMVLTSFNLDKSRHPDKIIRGDELDMVRIDGRVVWPGGST